MPLQWTQTNANANNRVSILIYGLPGAGKTSLAKTLPTTADNKVVYLAADPGQFVLRSRAFHAARLQSKADMDEAFKVLRATVGTANAPEWVFIDGLDECGELALKHFLANNKDGRAAYGEMADFMAMWTKAMRDLPFNVLFTTHITTEADDNGGRYHLPSFPGKKTNQVLVNWFDFVGCLRYVPDADGKQRRMIQFKGEADPKYTVKERHSSVGEWEQPDVAALFAKMGLLAKKETDNA